MLRIKLTFPFPDWPLSRQSPGGACQWGNYHFVLNPPGPNEEFDAWFVFDKVIGNKETTLCPEDNTIFISAEPPTLRKYSNLFLQQFNHVITCHDQIKHIHKHQILQGHPWFVNKTYDELIAGVLLTKTKTISVISSTKQFSEGHKKRPEFCYKLKDYFGDTLDLYGRGLKEFSDKWNFLAPYKFSLAIENASLNH